jgi:hypothetical protein
MNATNNRNQLILISPPSSNFMRGLLTFFFSIQTYICAFSNSIECPEKLSAYGMLDTTCPSFVAIRSFYGLNFGVSNSEISHSNGFEIFDLVTFFDDTDPARNAIFNTLSLQNNPLFPGTDSCNLLKFQNNILALIEDKIAFYPPEYFNSSSEVPALLHLINEVVGTGTFSFQTTSGTFLSITNEVLGLTALHRRFILTFSLQPRSAG